MTSFKFARRIVTALKFTIVAAIIGLSAPVAHADTWRGTAPFCEGKCPPGEKQIATSQCGNGACCWTGHKALCRNTAPTCIPKPVVAQCFVFVLMCDNGCSKFACGACFFF